jgi:hypothetical protein
LLSRAEQLVVLERSATTLLSWKEAAGLRPKPSELQDCRFDRELLAEVHLLRGLEAVAANDVPKAIACLDSVISVQPNDRTALLYRWAAAERRQSGLSSEDYVRITGEFVENARCGPSDCFGRTFQIVAGRGVAWSQRETLAKLREVLKDHPGSSLVNAAVAAQCYRLLLGWGLEELRDEAIAASCAAMRIERGSVLACYVLWHATFGLGNQEYSPKMVQEQLASLRLFPRSLYDAVAIGPECLVHEALFWSDEVLCSLLRRAPNK